jgi:hypothetical protein
LGVRIHNISMITLHVSFETMDNARTKQIAFDVVEMHYPYNTIFSRGSINMFEAIIGHSYLCMKMTTINIVIIVFKGQT